jgi:hypothetical protein
MKLFAQIRKVDEQKRLVYGRIAEEAVDKAGEIMDYMSSKPHFEKWSLEVQKDSGGRSKGNVRAMHGKVAAGLLKELQFDDVEKGIDVCAHIVDDNEWKKVEAGVYTGFSIGGSYDGPGRVEKIDGREVKRYTAKPSEVSLVDRPCMGGAKFFEIQKADGSLAKVEFKEPSEEDTVVQGTAEQVAELGKFMNAYGLTLTDLLEKALPSFVEKAFPPAEDKEAAAEEAAETPAGEKAEGENPATGGETEGDPKEQEPAEGAVGQKDGDAKPDDKAEKLDATADLQKMVSEALALQKAEHDQAMKKLVDDAVAPLAKRLEEADALIKKLGEQPAAASVKLRVLSKGEDVVDSPLAKKEPEAVVDSHGEKHEVAGLIKSLHRQGGVPLFGA